MMPKCALRTFSMADRTVAEADREQLVEAVVDPPEAEAAEEGSSECERPVRGEREARAARRHQRDIRRQERPVGDLGMDGVEGEDAHNAAGEVQAEAEARRRGERPYCARRPGTAGP